jgi:hypothetical protein
MFHHLFPFVLPLSAIRHQERETKAMKDISTILATSSPQMGERMRISEKKSKVHDFNGAWRAGLAMLFMLSLALMPGPVGAASSAACDGGGFSIVLPGSTVSGNQKGTIPAGSLGGSFLVKGKYVEFEVDSATFGIRNYTLTGAPNSLDITGGRRTTIFVDKTPDHRGLTLTNDLALELKDMDIVIDRTGLGLSMKIQAKDCAQGGIFQMEPARGDGGLTDITHTLATDSSDAAMTLFYFDNPNFQPGNFPPLPICPAGGPFTPECYPVPVTPRINFANDFSPNFVGRDSPQVAARLSQLGGVSAWRVASGGRMGMVLGEDAVEVAPPATACVTHCQAQDQVRGKFPILGFPFPVPTESRLTP